VIVAEEEICWSERAAFRLAREPGASVAQIYRVTVLREQARLPQIQVALAFDLDLPRRKAERRFCAVGNPLR
jgi:hypothetical protein